jgi:ABC-2 type transport system permease protein
VITPLVGAELRQLRKTPATWGLLAAALLLCLAWTAMVLAGVGGIESPPRGSMRLRDALFGASSIGCLPVLLLGVLAMTGEFHYRTATFAFLAVPVRSRVVAAKTVACLLLTPLIAVALVMVPYATGVITGAVELTLDRHLVAVCLRVVLVFACWAVVGAGIGAAVGNQTVAVVLPLLWFGVVEQMSGAYAFLQGLQAWLPGGLLVVVGGGRYPGSLPLWAAAAAFAAYLFVLFGAGLRRITRMDVT